MKRTITLLTVLNVAFGAAAYAAPPAAGSLASSSSPRTANPGTQVGGGGLDPTNPDVPGATGRTIVPGNTSTIAGDALATRTQQTGSLTASN
jgi:hypothetical protein